MRICHTVPLGSRTVVTRVLGRLMLFVQTADRAHAIHLMMNGYWEFELTRAIARAARRGTLAIDCGANYGYFAHVMAHFVGAAGHVVAIEPNPMIGILLKDSLRVNGFQSRTSVIEQAAWDTPHQEVEFMVPDTHPMNAKLQSLNRRQNREESNKVAIVRTMVLDELLALGRPVSVLKIDVEGAELETLCGAEKLIAQNPAINIFLEVNRSRYEDPLALVTILARHGLVARRLHASGAHPVVDMEAFCQNSASDPAMWWLTREVA